MQSQNGGWGAFDADNTRATVPRPAVLRLRRGDRPAQRRRHRARRSRCSAARAGGRAGRPRGHRVAAAPSRRPTARGSAAGASTTSTAPARPSRGSSTAASRGATHGCAARWPGWSEHQNADGGWGEDAPLLRRPGLDRPRSEHRVADGVGAARAARAGERTRGGGARRGLAGGDPAGGRRLGRAAVHRHRLPRRLLHQLPPVPAGLSGDGARGAGRRPASGARPWAEGHPPGRWRTRRSHARAFPKGCPVSRRSWPGRGARTSRSRAAFSARGSRDSLLAIYGFARLVDEVGDEVAGDRLALLDWLDAELDRIYAGGMPITRPAPAGGRHPSVGHPRGAAPPPGRGQPP